MGTFLLKGEVMVLDKLFFPLASVGFDGALTAHCLTLFHEVFEVYKPHRPA